MATKKNDGFLVQYWDSNLFIYFLMNEPRHKDRIDIIRALLRIAQHGKLRIVLSNLVLCEVRSRSEHDAEHRQIVDELFDANRPYVQFYALSRRIALRARAIGSQFNDITGPDAIHVATALEASVDTFLTYDGASEIGPEVRRNRRSARLLQFDGEIGTPPLKIEMPRLDLGPLFAELSQPS